MTTTSLVRKICQNGIVAAVYFVITLATPWISYGQLQFRIAELLVLLCFFRPDFVIGVTLGCFLANINSSIPGWDLLFGTLATLLSSLLIAYASPRLAVATLYPTLFNAFIVGAELTWVFGPAEWNWPLFWVNSLYVGLGEFTVMVASYIIMMILMRNKGFMNTINPTRHLAVKW
jgi:uncharacterized membrane protein